MITHVREWRPYTEVDRVARLTAQVARPVGGPARPRRVSAKAQDWSDYLHWPYIPPQNPGNGLEYKSLYDGWYIYPREQRIVPQIQGPFYRNYYGGSGIFGIPSTPRPIHPWNKRKFYQGNHYYLDVF